MSRYLTHLKKLNDPEESQKFFDVFEPTYKNLGPVLIQLPRLLGFNSEKAENLYHILKTKYKPFMFSIEVRRESWLTQESIDLMKKYKIGFVISQSGTALPYKNKKCRL
jgi:uncharacterized protein YecE (DUF72 family)